MYHKYDVNYHQAKLIIDLLIEKGLLDDYRYALSKVTSFRSNFYSKRKMNQKLIQAGISQETIDSVLVDENDSDLLACKKRAEKYLRSITNKSYNAKKTAIMAKLLNDGFDYELSKQAMNALDFSNSILQEKELIRKEANKALKKYERKFKDTELRNKVYLYLASKGFVADDIYALINEMEL